MKPIFDFSVLPYASYLVRPCAWGLGGSALVSVFTGQSVWTIFAVFLTLPLALGLLVLAWIYIWAPIYLLLRLATAGWERRMKAWEDDISSLLIVRLIEQNHLHIGGEIEVSLISKRFSWHFHPKIARRARGGCWQDHPAEDDLDAQMMKALAARFGWLRARLLCFSNPPRIFSLPLSPGSNHQVLSAIAKTGQALSCPPEAA